MPFEALRERLLEGGIAPRRVRRYLGELNDHLAELTQSERTAGYPPKEAATRARALLGSDDELTEAWLAQPRFKSFTARAPWLVFGVLPPVTLLLAAVVSILVLVLLMGSLDMLGRHAVAGPPWFSAAEQAGIFVSNLLAVPAIATLFVIIAWRQRLRPLWPTLAVLVIAALSMHWDNAPLVRDSHSWGAELSLRYRDSGHSIHVGLTPIFFYAWWKAMAAHGLVMTAQYLLTLLPLAWLLRVRAKTIAPQ